MIDWQKLGYDHRVSGWVPKSVPEHHDPVTVGEMIRQGDIAWHPQQGWVGISQEHWGHFVAKGSRCVCRPSARWWNWVLDSTWKCTSPRCRVRENDRGHACYWCGRHEKDNSEITQPMDLPF